MAELSKKLKLPDRLWPRLTCIWFKNVVAAKANSNMVFILVFEGEEGQFYFTARYVRACVCGMPSDTVYVHLMCLCHVLINTDLFNKCKKISSNIHTFTLNCILNLDPTIGPY